MSQDQLFFKSSRFWKRVALFSLVIPLLMFAGILLVFYFSQDAIIQSQIEKLNKEHKGQISVGDSHLSPFKSFPYTSVKIDDVKILESKEDTAAVILDVEDIYVSNVAVKIAPNPFDANGTIIELVGLEGVNDVTFKLFDVAGKSVQSQQFNSHKFQFYPADLPQGLYIYTINVEGALINSGKVFIK